MNVCEGCYITRSSKFSFKTIPFIIDDVFEDLLHTKDGVFKIGSLRSDLEAIVSTVCKESDMDDVSLYHSKNLTIYLMCRDFQNLYVSPTFNQITYVSRSSTSRKGNSHYSWIDETEVQRGTEEGASSSWWSSQVAPQVILQVLVSEL